MSKRAKPDEWMPFHVGPYLRKTMHLTTEQHGAYMLLLMTYWVQQAPLDDDDMQLSAIVKVSVKRWKIALRPVLEKFFRVGDGKWVQERAQFEINRAVEISETRSIAGKAGGEASAATRTKLQPNATANGKAKPEQTGQQTPKQNATHLTEVHLNSERAALYDPRARLQKLCSVLKVSPATDASIILKWPEELASLMADGLDFDRHIIPAAHHVVSRGTRVKSLNYLRGKALELQAAEQPAPVEIESTDADGWAKRMRVYAGDTTLPKGTWSTKWGPKPGEAGCLCPVEIAAQRNGSPPGIEARH